MTTSEVPPAEKTGMNGCPLCGTALDPVHPNECSRCDWVAGYRRHSDENEKPAGRDDILSMVMSVVPGLGHWYKGHRFAGVVLMVSTALVAFFSLATVSATAGVALLLIPIYWSCVMLHAYWSEDLRTHRHLGAR